MKVFFVALLATSMLSFNAWQTDFEIARTIAKEKHQLILLNFSGSDWCGPCIRMKKEIFNDSQFASWADTALVMFNADFPRNKKNQLDKTLKANNEKLADKYNPLGKFPFTVLLNANGDILKSWDGLPDETPAAFVKEIKKVYDSGKR